jgi:hypothetical protein
MTDFIFTDHGSVVTIEAVTDEAQQLANDYFGVEGWQGLPTNFTTDWRAGALMFENLQAEGYEIQVQQGGR